MTTNNEAQHLERQLEKLEWKHRLLEQEIQQLRDRMTRVVYPGVAPDGEPLNTREKTQALAIEGFHLRKSFINPDKWVVDNAGHADIHTDEMLHFTGWTKDEAVNKAHRHVFGPKE